jgi:leucyl aminopeptidase
MQSTNQNLTALLPHLVVADAVVIGVFSEGPLSAAALAIDQATGSVVSKLRERGEFAAKVAEILPLHSPNGVHAGLVLLVGLGKPTEWSITTAHRVAGAAAKWLASKPRKTAAFYLAEGQSPELAETMIASAMVGGVGQDLYRAQRNRHSLEQMLWYGVAAETLARGKILGDACNLTRLLVNEPPNLMYPELLAAQAKRVATDCGLGCEIWDETRLEKEKCGSLLAVAKGSSNPPRLVILDYQGAGKGAPTLALVGKGVTFDSGGAMQAIALLKLPVNVMGLMGIVENMLGGDCFKLGDVLTARSGKTIEVLNTDAEGRLVLADVLDVAKERGAAKIVDLATLTGACVVALGTDIAGVMSNSEEWSGQVLAAANATGELAWPLPMFREFDEHIQSEIADIKNVGNGRWGGAITAAKFLEAFVGDTPWVHVDIAGPAFADKPRAWIDGGGSGYFVRTLVELCRKLSS